MMLLLYQHPCHRIPPPKFITDINLFHCIYDHADETFLKHTARKLNVTLEGQMHACTGCSMAKDTERVFLVKLRIELKTCLVEFSEMYKMKRMWPRWGKNIWQ